MLAGLFLYTYHPFLLPKDSSIGSERIDTTFGTTLFTSRETSKTSHAILFTSRTEFFR